MDKKLFLIALLLPLLTSNVFSQPQEGQGEQILRDIFAPFLGAVAVFVAIVFGIGILGFAILVIQGVLRWIIGGSFGRSLAVSTWIRAIETLAIIPLIFIMVNILGTLEIVVGEDTRIFQEVANVLNNLLVKGWQTIIGVLTG